jgi:hypothetical protein
MNEYTIDHKERRGIITYTVGLEVREMEGHFRRSAGGQHVEARRLYGRNRFGVCRLEDLLDFKEVTK